MHAIGLWLGFYLWVWIALARCSDLIGIRSTRWKCKQSVLVTSYGTYDKIELPKWSFCQPIHFHQNAFISQLVLFALDDLHSVNSPTFFARSRWMHLPCVICRSHESSTRCNVVRASCSVAAIQLSNFDFALNCTFCKKLYPRIAMLVRSETFHY